MTVAIGVSQSPSKLRVSHEMVVACQRTLLKQILGHGSAQTVKDDCRGSGLEEQYLELSAFLQKVTSQQESNSILLYGPRGSGKTKVLEAALASCCRSTAESSSIIVRLNGMIHTDDRLALIDILRQLQTSTSVSDLLTKSSKSFADCLRSLLSIQEHASTNAAPIIFVLDEFDAFTCHPKQTLLYNLFELAQSRTRTVAVIGLTCRWDAVELLEKRVRSRFSNRQIQFHLPVSLGLFSHMVQSRLSLPTDFSFADYAQQFNAQVETLMEHATFIELYSRIFDFHADVQYFLNSMIPAVYGLSTLEPYLTLTATTAAADSQFKDYWMDILLGLSLLELSLLLAMKKLVEAEVSIFNFELIYQEYKSLFTRSVAESLEKAPKNQALRAFEYLVSIEILQYLTATSQMPVDCRPVRLTIMPHIISAAVTVLPNCPAILKSWISK